MEAFFYIDITITNKNIAFLREEAKNDFKKND